MSNQLPISPITGEPSQLRALVERSVYKHHAALQANQAVWQGHRHEAPQFYPAHALAPGLLPGAQLSMGHGGLSPHEATHPQRSHVQQSHAVATQDVVLMVQRSLAPVMRQLASQLSELIAQIDRTA